MRYDVEYFQEITVDKGKKIFVFDDVYEMQFRRDVFQFILNSRYVLGWQDTEDPHNAQHVYLHSKYSTEDVEQSGILTNIKHPKLLQMLQGRKMGRATINLSLITDTYFAHPHRTVTMLYYANPQWKEEWAGETLFYNEQVSEVVYTSMYKPGRVVLFDGTIPHSIRPQSKVAPNHRFTYALFFDEGIGFNYNNN